VSLVIANVRDPNADEELQSPSRERESLIGERNIGLFNRMKAARSSSWIRGLQSRNCSRATAASKLHSISGAGQSHQTCLNELAARYGATGVGSAGNQCNHEQARLETPGTGAEQCPHAMVANVGTSSAYVWCRDKTDLLVQR